MWAEQLVTDLAVKTAWKSVVTWVASKVANSVARKVSRLAEWTVSIGDVLSAAMKAEWMAVWSDSSKAVTKVES